MGIREGGNEGQASERERHVNPQTLILFLDPQAGDARYYLAAVIYQCQRRAGRSSVNGVLQGRNGAALPGCQ